MKKTHFDHLLEVIPDLSQRRILDLGAGRGEFLIDVALRNVRAIGLEYNPAYISEALHNAQRSGVSIALQQGTREALPFEDASSYFVNMSEVIELV